MSRFGKRIGTVLNLVQFGGLIYDGIRSLLGKKAPQPEATPPLPLVRPKGPEPQRDPYFSDDASRGPDTVRVPTLRGVPTPPPQKPS